MSINDVEQLQKILEFSKKPESFKLEKNGCNSEWVKEPHEKDDGHFGIKKYVLAIVGSGLIPNWFERDLFKKLQSLALIPEDQAKMKLVSLYKKKGQNFGFLNFNSEEDMKTF